MALIGLLLRLKNHKALFSLALFLLVISSLIEIAIPQIVRFTIDHYVLPRYAVDRKTGNFVDITKIPKWELESRVGKERYYKTPVGYVRPDSLLALPKGKNIEIQGGGYKGYKG
jgi:ABC-type multidrug transport system fused ATPase/permease subunit